MDRERETPLYKERKKLRLTHRDNFWSAAETQTDMKTTQAENFRIETHLWNLKTQRGLQNTEMIIFAVCMDMVNYRLEPQMALHIIVYRNWEEDDVIIIQQSFR